MASMDHVGEKNAVAVIVGSTQPTCNCYYLDWMVEAPVGFKIAAGLIENLANEL